ncbi:MAG: hypothetical protein PUB32_04860 [Clostridiales bacterium]|nr:hypothetical protein [Clostridiales bacterium]
MKTTFKVIIALAAAILAAFVVRAMHLSVGTQPEGGTVLDVYQNMMLQSREMFLEKSEDIQLATLALLEQDDLNIMSDSQGHPWVMGENDELIEPETVVSGELQPYLDNMFGEYACGGKMYNVRVTDKAILFFTGYHKSGSVGFLYERELGSLTDFTELLELSENWKIFYNMPEG